MSDTHPIVKWVKALRSGDYKQSRQALRRGDSFCCLGVANDLFLQEHPTRGRWTANGCLFDLTIDGEYEVILLHPQVARWMGFDSPSSTEMKRYLKMNDSEGLSFSQIATAIELNHPELFHIRMATYDGSVDDSPTLVAS